MRYTLELGDANITRWRLDMALECGFAQWLDGDRYYRSKTKHQQEVIKDDLVGHIFSASIGLDAETASLGLKETGLIEFYR